MKTNREIDNLKMVAAELQLTPRALADAWLKDVMQMAERYKESLSKYILANSYSVEFEAEFRRRCQEIIANALTLS